jgi:large subunit ribosomal protein L9
MQILLKENVEHLGSTGQLVDVKPGYARNYLVPKGYAIHVTRKNIKSIELEVEKFRIAEQKKLAVTEGLAKKISEVNCTVAVQADENDKLFGAVTSEDIAKAIKISDITVEAKQIKIPRPIKSIGVFDAKVNLEMGVVAELKVWVVKE